MDKDLDLLYELGTFRFVNRTWRQFLGAPFANNAEHTFRTMWIALTLAEQENAATGTEINREKLMKMALIHDVPESRLGDTHHVSRLYNTRQFEGRAMNDMFKNTSLRKEVLALWKEYQAKRSLEAKIVKDADSLDVDMELREQAANGNVLKDKFMWTRKLVREKLYTKSAKQMWDEIYKTDPHNWHITTRNRFTAGDYKKRKK